MIESEPLLRGRLQLLADVAVQPLKILQVRVVQPRREQDRPLFNNFL